MLEDAKAMLAEEDKERTQEGPASARDCTCGNQILLPTCIVVCNQT